MREHGPLYLPPQTWRQAETGQALRDRNITQLLQITQRYTGVSQARIASAIGVGQSRTNEIFNGRRQVSTFDVIERIADGLSMPDNARMLLGLAPRMARHAASLDDLASLAGVISHAYTSQAAAARDIRSRIPNASTVDMIAVRGLGLLGLNDSLLRTLLTASRPRPLALNVALLNPESPYAARRAAEIGESLEAFAAAVRLSEQRLADLSAYDALSIKVYRYDALPTWRIIAVDDTIFVGTFDELWEGHESPMYRLDAGTGGALHRGMRRMCDGVLEESRQTIWEDEHDRGRT